MFVWAVGKYNWTNNIDISQSGFSQLLLLLMKSQENDVHGDGRRFNCYLSYGKTYFCCICRLGLACGSCPGLQRVQHDIPGLTGKSSEVAILERMSRPKHTESKIVHTLLRETIFNKETSLHKKQETYLNAWKSQSSNDNIQRTPTNKVNRQANLNFKSPELIRLCLYQCACVHKTHICFLD